MHLADFDPALDQLGTRGTDVRDDVPIFTR